MEELINKRIFNFAISEKSSDIPSFDRYIPFGKYTIGIDMRTPYDYESTGDTECFIFGYAVNVVGIQQESIVTHILKNISSIDDLVTYEQSLGGKYLILYKNKNKYYCIGDATCSIPIYFTTENHLFICASNEHYIARNLRFKKDIVLQNVRQSGDISQALPFDITQYQEIKALIPNHYLDFTLQKSVRFCNCLKKQTYISAREAAEITAPMIEVLTRYYIDLFPIYCPITSGRDSRVVLASLLKNCNATIPTYTIRHTNHTGEEQDLYIPKLLAKRVDISHQEISDVNVSDKLVDEVDRQLGKNNYAKKTLTIAHTIKTYVGDGAVINGDIIGQVGKCSLHRDIPSVLATPGYFRCKLHNYSKESKFILGEWLQEIRCSEEHINTFDLFSIENRMGRWAAQENQLYNLIGQLYLNVFNSRSIIYKWTAVDRKERKLSKIHIEMIRKWIPALLEVPFEKDENHFVRLAKANGILYYLSSYLKFYLERIKFRKEEA